MVGRRKEEGRGQVTALDRWLSSGTRKQDTDTKAEPQGRQGSFRMVGKEEGSGLESIGPEKGREGSACPKEEGTLSQQEVSKRLERTS